MKKYPALALGCAVSMLLLACSRSEPETNAAATTPAAVVDTTPAATDNAAAATVGGLQDREGKPVAVVPFDISRIATTDKPLGALPFFGLPQGYEPLNAPHVRAWARFPLRMGDGVHWVEGPSWSAQIVVPSSAGKSFSALELERNLDTLLSAAGASKVFEGPEHRDIYYGPQLEDEIGGGFIDAVNNGADAPTSVWVIRQPQRNIWVQLSLDDLHAGMVVLEEVPFTPTAHWSDSFPHLSLPAGYNDRNKPLQRDFDRFPFWTGDHFEQVEGKLWAADFDKPERAYSLHEVRRNLEAMMATVNATTVFDGRIPKAQAESVPESVRSAYSGSAGYNWDDFDLVVYRADLPDGRQIWVHARLEYLSAGWVVVERKGLQQTAALLPAAALKQQLDSQGRVAIQVNFATDQAQILPDSQPQLEQVLAVLKQDPALQLSVEGHTDNSGNAAHNQQLSDARAASVVASLAAAGIAPARLQARGWGQDKPVADNASEAGRASNRRVELVKR
ncbi:OmpA family protein [Stenotrophomonas sp.]|uniref:OmpA family protein n=1 Tax=Stenotrophomonas sp. TaxID=69392 RepID=UPI0028AF65DB|nr:OmpA family protein [Stenotrophomonas sp.]